MVIVFIDFSFLMPAVLHHNARFTQYAFVISLQTFSCNHPKTQVNLKCREAEGIQKQDTDED